MSDALALYNPADYDLSGATADELVKQLALVGKRRRRRRADDESSLESESDEDDDLEPPGPLDPEHCLVTGNGASGGAAGAVATFKVVCKDSKGKRVAEGGAPMMASVAPKSLGAKEVGEQIAVLIKDNGDGSYSGMYTVSARGNYELIVEINAVPTGGSPYPVFFSPPEAEETGPAAEALPGDARAAALADATGPAATNSLAATAQEVARMLQPDLARISAATDAATAAMLAQQNSMGPAAISSGVRLPSREEKQMRTLLLWGISKSLSPEQLKQLFGFCGTVKRAEIVGVGGHYALVEYKKEEEAKAALAMEGMSVMGSTLRVELTRSAVNASANLPRDSSAPFAAMQAHQLAQLQLQVMQAQGHQDSLAAQVAQMRAAAKTFASTPSQPLVANNSQSQKAAALAAAAALSKRLTGISTSYTPPEEKERSRERSRDFDQREHSPGPGAGRRGPKPYSPPRKRPSGRARSASPRSRAVRLQRTDNREREAMRAQEEGRHRPHPGRRSRSPPPRRRSRSPRRRSRSPVRSSRAGRRSPSPLPSSRRSRSRRRSPSPLLRRRSRTPPRRPRDKSRDCGRYHRDQLDAGRDRRGSRSNRDRSPIPRTRTPDRRDRRSPGRGSERQRYDERQRHDDDVRGNRRRERSRDRQPPATTPPAVSTAKTDDGASPQAVDTADRTTAAVEAAVAGADAAAAVAGGDAAAAVSGPDASADVQEAADTGGAPDQAEPTQPAANGHAPKSDAGNGAAPLSADVEPAKAGDYAEGKRSHRKYRKREGSHLVSPRRDDKRSKKRRHHDKLDRDGNEKQHKHKHHKRRHNRERHSDDEAQPALGNGLKADPSTISPPAGTEPVGVEQQEKEQLQLRELALSKLDPLANGIDGGTDVRVSTVDSETDAVADKAGEHATATD